MTAHSCFLALLLFCSPARLSAGGCAEFRDCRPFVLSQVSGAGADDYSGRGPRQPGCRYGRHPRESQSGEGLLLTLDRIVFPFPHAEYRFRLFYARDCSQSISSAPRVLETNTQQFCFGLVSGVTWMSLSPIPPICSPFVAVVCGKRGSVDEDAGHAVRSEQSRSFEGWKSSVLVNFASCVVVLIGPHPRHSRIAVVGASCVLSLSFVLYTISSSPAR